MSDAVTAKLATTGVWFFTDMLSTEQSRETAARIESLGYSALWIPDTLGRDPFVNAAILLDSTTELIVATGIANIHMRHPGMMKQGAFSLAELSGGRFVLGLGVSHAPMVEGLRQLPYDKPLTTMRTYVDAMNASMYAATPPAEEPTVVLAALGPKMLELAAERTSGTITWMTGPITIGDHVRPAIGPDAQIAAGVGIQATDDVEAARAKANIDLAIYGQLPSYRAMLDREGATNPADLVLMGDAATIRNGLEAYKAAGATECALNIMGDKEAAWEALAPLGSQI